MGNKAQASWELGTLFHFLIKLKFKGIKLKFQHFFMIFYNFGRQHILRDNFSIRLLLFWYKPRIIFLIPRNCIYPQHNFFYRNFRLEQNK